MKSNLPLHILHLSAVGIQCILYSSFFHRAKTQCLTISLKNFRTHITKIKKGRSNSKQINQPELLVIEPILLPELAKQQNCNELAEKQS